MVDTKFLDGTRFLLSLWVVVGHFYIYAGASDFLNLTILGAILGSPAYAVDGFMVITGFLMTYNYILRIEKEPPLLKSTHRKFWLRRFFRLYPVYLLFIIIGYFFKPDLIAQVVNMKEYFSGNGDVSGFDFTTQQPDLLELISHVFLIQGLIPSHTSSINAVTWSLSLEMQFYALFPFIFIWLLSNINKVKDRLVVFFVLSIIISVVSTILGSFMGYYYPSVIINKLPLFIFGIILASTITKQINEKYLWLSLFLLAPSLNLLQAIIIGFIVLFLNLKNLKDFLPKWSYNILLSINDLLSNRFSEFGANISYSLYLSHAFFIVYITKWVIPFGFNKYLTALISLGIIILSSFIFSHLLFKYYERPLNNLGRKVIRKNTYTLVTKEKIS